MWVKSATWLVMPLLCLLCLSACKNSTTTERGDISGLIQLNDQADHSGITVSVYRAGVVPDSLLSIRQEYPQLAFPITDKVCFDHRLFEPLKTVTTNLDGRFTIENLPYDDYIIVYFKEGWGVNYLFDVQLDRAEFNINTMYPDLIFQLNSVIQVPLVINGEYSFLPDHCYVVSGNTYALDSSSLVFHGNSRVYFSPGAKFSLYGNSTFPNGEDLVSFTSFASLYAGNLNTSDFGEGLVAEVEVDIRNVSVSLLNTGISVKSDNSVVRNAIFRSCLFGLTANAVTNLVFRNNIIMDNRAPIGSAVNLYSVALADVNHNIFYNNYNSLKNEIVESHIYDNAFISGDMEFISTTDSECLFEYNLIANSINGVENSGKSNLEARFNEIQATNGIINAPSNHGYNVINEGWTKAGFNNLSATQYAVNSIAGYYYPEGPYPLDFKNNFWDVTTSSEIDDLINDFNDIGLVVGSGVSSIVNYSPFRTTRVTSAGIRSQ